MIDFFHLFSAWPTKEILGKTLPFRPTRYRAINEDELLELKCAAIEERQAEVTVLCEGPGISISLYEFEPHEHMQHPRKIIVFACEYSAILLTE